MSKLKVNCSTCDNNKNNKHAFFYDKLIKNHRGINCRICAKPPKTCPYYVPQSK